MSIRAREKVLVLLEEISKDFQKSAQQVAYVSGLCFMLLGASMALAFSSNVTNQSQSALISSTTAGFSNTVNKTTNLTPTPNLVPEVSLLDSLPTDSTVLTEHKLAVLNAKNVYVKSRSLSDGKVSTLHIDNLSPELYKFTIEPDKLTPGKHSLLAYIESAVDGSKHSFNLGDFSVPPQQNHLSQTATTTLSSSSTTQNRVSLADTTTTQSQTATTSTTENQQTVLTNGPSLKVSVPGSDLKDRVLVKIQASDDVAFIEMYVRHPNSTNSRFVGLAEKRPDSWYFFFNTIDVPNGEYEMVARTRASAKDYFSSGVKIRVSNFTPIQEPEAVVSDENELTHEESEVNIEPETTNGRSLPDFTLTDINESDSPDITIPAPHEVRELLTLHEEEIRELFNRFAVAQQSGDPLLIELARKELTIGREKILNDILTDQSINYLADEAETVLEERFSILEKRVSTFEELRRTASDSETSADTDKDGVSDFDEQNLYSTNPELPDSDNDGIQDGVEIMRGFDPLNSDTEAVIQYEMPQESLALIQEDTLKVERIAPVIKSEDTGKSVQAEITGKGLPNSYVTLYIFSTPTVVTVRTDEAGLFSYTFEKELEDGDHEVYVAITDNTGAIVARSNPFRFVKQAEAFTPLEGNVEQVANQESFGSISSFDTYNTVVGLGILAFGLILLMLGVSMREKAGVAPQEPSHAVKIS
ncbi:MAG: hypothetical protein KBC62_03640 [Candidatus Pacebacteria bacterium]|nr:hypothetical protein [Candidatus Paceibacterota bacterium]MBP9843072.1 hypothetical protein [Candidatus Paceibacterota bacterium]